MENKEFKRIFGKVAKNNGFLYKFNFWYKESSECIFTIDLQKSYYANIFYVNLKIFVKGTFGKIYLIDKELKKNTGNFFRRTPKEYDDFMNLHNHFSEEVTEKGLEDLFSKFIISFSDKSLTINGIYEMVEAKEISLLPAVKLELEKLSKT